MKKMLLALVVVLFAVSFAGCDGTMSSRESGQAVYSKVVHEAGTGNLQQALDKCDYGAKDWNSCVQAYDPEHSYRLIRENGQPKIVRGGGSEQPENCRLFYVYDARSNALLGTTCIRTGK